MALQLPQDRFTTVNGVRTRYWAQGGQGSPVLLIHGLGGFIESWMYNIEPLAGNHRVYAVDLLGFGQTDKKPLVNDLNLLVKFVGDFMETQQIPKASLVGNSLGGGLALQFAVDNPGKVEKLVLVDNAGMGREVCNDFKLCVLPMFNVFLNRQIKKTAFSIMEHLVFDTSVITPEFQDLSYKYATADGAVKAMVSALTAGINLFGQKSKLTRPLLERLNTVNAPALIIWGKQDRIIPVSHAQIAAEKIPNARLELFDNCGHMPQFEHPDKFNHLVLDFLDGKSEIRGSVKERSVLSPLVGES